MSANTTRMTTKFRELLKKGMVVAPLCYDTVTARCAELAGFEAIYIGGMAFEATHNGKPDMGFTTATELAEGCYRIASSVDIPAIADIDTGFGGTVNVHRTIRLMESAGVAGVHIEDQILPKQCAAIQAGERVVSRQEALDRLKAALDARTDPDFLIIGRSEAGYLGFDELVERCNMFLEAGADMAFANYYHIKTPDGRTWVEMTPAEQMDLLRRLVKAVNGPISNVGIPAPDGYTDADLAEMGFAFHFYSTEPLVAAYESIMTMLKSIRETGNVTAYQKDHPSPYWKNPGMFQSLFHMDEYIRISESRWNK